MEGLGRQRISLMLRDAFQRKLKHNPHYSQAALARDMGVSSAFVTNILTGKKYPPQERLARMIDLLELDANEKEELIEALVLEKTAPQTLIRFLKKTPQEQTKTQRKRMASTKAVLSRWYHLAVLECLFTDITNAGTAAIAKALGLSRYIVEESIQLLEKEGLILQTPDGWQRLEKDFYFPAGRPRPELWQYHSQLLDNAKQELKKEVNQQQMNERAFTAFTFACRPEDVEQMKVKIQNFLSELTAAASEGQCPDVYQLSLQLFPLTKKKGE